jgi:hypothetical protein
VIKPGPLFRRYVLDSCFLSDLWSSEGTYARDRHQGLWRHFESQVDSGEIIAPKEVREELTRCLDDQLDRWLGKHGAMFVEVHSSQIAVLERIVRMYPAFTRGKEHLADPAVVSLAAAEGLAVLTSERYQTTPSATLPKVPNLCEQHHVQCYGVNDYLRAENVVQG